MRDARSVPANTGKGGDAKKRTSASKVGTEEGETEQTILKRLCHEIFRPQVYFANKTGKERRTKKGVICYVDLQ